ASRAAPQRADARPLTRGPRGDVSSGVEAARRGAANATSVLARRRRGGFATRAAVKPKLLVVAGPTASGKSALAVELARERGGEIVSADSQAVYRHFDIGTAKPSAEQLAAVPHHLISIVEPTETFSAARFLQLADAAV